MNYFFASDSIILLYRSKNLGITSRQTINIVDARTLFFKKRCTEGINGTIIVAGEKKSLIRGKKKSARACNPKRLACRSRDIFSRCFYICRARKTKPLCVFSFQFCLCAPWLQTQFEVCKALFKLDLYKLIFAPHHRSSHFIFTSLRYFFT